MKIVFINTFDIRGGAAIVAHRLAQALKEQYSVKCFFLVGTKILREEEISATRTKTERYAERVLDIFLNKIGLQYFFFPFSSRTILQKLKELKPDIISLHNTHGGYFQTSLLTKISKVAPVVWTLHDMWSFTGNAAHTFGDESWRQMKNSSHLKNIYPAIGINTGAFLLKQKKRIYSQSDVTLVTPSRWLLELASQSPLFSGKRIHQINNGVDLNIFKPYDKRTARLELGLPETEKIVLFSAEFLKSPWKGGNDLLQVLEIISTALQDKVHLLIVGAGEMETLEKFSNLIVHTTGYIEREIVMSKYFACSDVFLYPTRADNLPNVLIETISSGTPAVTFNTGGCAEIIVNGYNGVVVEVADYPAMAQAVARMITDPDARESMAIHARLYAEQNFSISEMAKKYNDLFTEILMSR